MSEERQQLRAAVASAIAKHAMPRDSLGAKAPDLKAWQVLAGDVGVAGLLVPEANGGAGAAFADAAAVFEEAGKTLAPLPLLSTVGLATSTLLACRNNEPAAQLLERIAEEALVATVAFGAPGGGEVTAALDGAGWRLTGKRGFVLDAASADLLLVTATANETTGLFAVAGDAAGLQRRMLTSLDLTRALGEVEFDSTPAVLIADAEIAADTVDVGQDLALALWAAESVASAQHCLDEAVAYAKQRTQFDRKIGSFQAIKHTLVDILLAVEMARSTADVAVAAADAWLAQDSAQTRTALAVAASSAAATCAEAFMFTAEETLHVFGGIGFTWEHDAHLYYRRAKFGELYFGTADRHRERVARLAGLGAGLA